jgi:hypothetical protein
MGKHYIPQFYLKGFSEGPASPFIWTYWQGTGRKFRPNIRKIAQENDYFTDKTERFLAQIIEGPTKSVLEKIKNYEAISPKDKKTLSDFMSVLIKSVPHGRNHAIRTFIENFDNIFDDICSQLLSQIDENPAKREIVKKRIEQVKTIQKENRIEAKDIWENFIPPSNDSVVSDIINIMTWLFLVSKEPTFLTSDNPIFWFESIGVGKPHSEISFPISPQVTLWATWRGDINDGYVLISDRIVHEINRRTIDFAQNFIFSSIPEEWISKAVNKSRHKLNLINLKVDNSRIYHQLSR